VIEDAPDWLDGRRARGSKARIAGWRRGRRWRAWIAMLARLGGPADPDFVDWLAVDRVEGRDSISGCTATGSTRRKPLAETVLKPAHGVIVTSATLRGGGDWSVAEARSGACIWSASRFAVEASPFDYAAQAEVLIVTDVKRGDMARWPGPMRG
jgi:ATP-dependent DNA helicase DinG